MKILVLYYSKTGHTLEAVRPMIEGITESGSTVDTVTAKKFQNTMLSDYDALIIASPCWGGSTGITGAATPITKVLKKLDDGCLKNMTCGGISVHAMSGGKATLSHIEKLLAAKGCVNFKKGPVGKAGTPVSIGKGKSVSSEDAIRFKNFGKEFADGIN